MPGKGLTSSRGTTKVLIRPGESPFWPANRRGPIYFAQVDGESIPFLMRQEGQIRNAMVIFFLRGRGTEFHARVREYRGRRLARPNGRPKERGDEARSSDARSRNSKNSGRLPPMQKAPNGSRSPDLGWREIGCRHKLRELPVEIHRDEAGNVWSTLRRLFVTALRVGGHIDSVPNGGWLDGCLNLLAGVEIMRRIQTQYAAIRRSPIAWWIGPMRKARVSEGAFSALLHARVFSISTRPGV